MKKIFIFQFACVLAFTSLQAQKTTQLAWPKHPVSKIFKDFLIAYNTGQGKNYISFCQKYYSKPARAIRRMHQIFSQYGKLSPYKITVQRKDRLGAWFLGTDTKNWVEITFVTNKEGKIRGAGLMRGMRPNGLLPPYKALATNDMSTYLDSYLKKLSKMDHFSGAVLVAKGDKILFEGAYGYRDKKKGLKNNLNTTFRIASTSKTFTAIAIAQLAEKGKLKYTDYISKFIPEYPKDIANQVTIHHLLTHTSGIELDDYEPFNKAIQSAKNVEGLLKAQLKYLDHMNKNRRKNFKVLNKHDYSNENFSLLGVIIERVSKMPFAQYIEQNILKPAEMTNSYTDYKKLAQINNKAIGYTYYDNDHNFVPGKRRENTAFIDSIASPAGGIYSSVRDLYKYYKAINQNKLINKSSRETLFKTQAKVFKIKEMGLENAYGYGFSRRRLGKAFLIGHAGRSVGVGSRFEYYPKQDIYVIVLSNYGFPANNPASHICDLIEPNN